MSDIVERLRGWPSRLICRNQLSGGWNETDPHTHADDDLYTGPNDG